MLIDLFSIPGTNYDASMYDPLRWGKESYYEELAKAQKEEMDKRNKEQKEKTTKVCDRFIRIWMYEIKL